VTKNHLQARGLTLVELMITIAVASILLSLAVPSFTTSIRNNRMVTDINELHASLSLARSEAVKRDRNVTMCRSSNGSSCTGNWQDGWIVFVDNNFNGAVDAGDEILRQHGALGGGDSLAFSQTRVIYDSSGLARTGSNGTFTLCDSRGAQSAKGLVIGVSGRPRLAIDTDSNGIPEDENGNDLACS